MDAQWEKLFKTQLDDKKIGVLKKKLAREVEVADKFEGELKNVQNNLKALGKSASEVNPIVMNSMAELISETERQVKSARRQAEATRQDIRVLELQADSESIEKSVKKGIQQFLTGDRYDIEKREDFNDWCKTLASASPSLKQPTQCHASGSPARQVPLKCTSTGKTAKQLETPALWIWNSLTLVMRSFSSVWARF